MSLSLKDLKTLCDINLVLNYADIISLFKKHNWSGNICLIIWRYFQKAIDKHTADEMMMLRKTQN